VDEQKQLRMLEIFIIGFILHYSKNGNVWLTAHEVENTGVNYTTGSFIICTVSLILEY
jgi:hypothetical protein